MEHTLTAYRNGNQPIKVHGELEDILVTAKALLALDNVWNVVIYDKVGNRVESYNYPQEVTL